MAPKSIFDAKHTQASSLGQISSCPYEGDESAEVGEQLFEHIQSLMIPSTGLINQIQNKKLFPSDEAIEVFGEKEAEAILETSKRVSSSKILYGIGWTEGIIQGWRCAPLEKELLLLCLHDHRIARSDASGLKQVIKDLGLWEIVLGVLSKWNLGGRFPCLFRCKNITSFKKKQAQAFKCILFLARAATCMKYLGWDFLAIPENANLKKKIYAYLSVLESLQTVKQTKKYCDLTKRLRSKDLKIVGVTIHGRSGKERDYPMEQFPKASSSDRHNSSCNEKNYKKTPIPNDSMITKTRKRPLNMTSQGILSKEHHTLNPRFSHELFDTKNHVSQKGDGTGSTIVSQSSERENSNSILIDSSLSRAKRTKPGISHMLCTKAANGQKVVDVPRHIASAATRGLVSYVSDGSSMHSNSNDPNFWYPVDPEEIILSPLQIETAWLVEESMYCNRKRNVDWMFVMNYASPALQIKLRKIPDVVGSDDEEILSKLLHNGIEAKRFAIVRRDVRRKLVKSEVRTRMKSILPGLRKATHPIRLEKERLKNTIIL